MNSISRRHIFQGALLAGAVPTGGYGTVRSLKAMGYRSPNEKLNIASIGAGGRATSDINGCSSENIVALADPDFRNAAATFEKYPKATRYKDFRQMLDKERNNIDAVIVGTPDHMHGMAAMWAMQRGKHVYCEKPLTRTPWEARQLALASARYGVATQMGNQGYSNDGARVASEIVWSGALGEVTEVHAWTTRPVWPQGMQEIPAPTKVPDTLDWDLWLGIAENRPFTAGVEEANATGTTASGTVNFGRRGFYLPFNWRGHFDFGCGPLGDMACHLLGAVNMALLLGAPKSVQVLSQEGKSKFAFPAKSVTVFEFPARRNMAPLKLYWYDAATGPAYMPQGWHDEMPLIGGEDAFGWNPPPPPEMANMPRRPQPRGFANREGVVWIGTKGMMTTDTYANRVRLLPEERHKEFKLPDQVLTRSPGHYRDWIRACKGGEPACSNFSVAGPFTEWITMGVIALHYEGKLEWDAAKMEFTNNKEATKRVRPTFRKGWKFEG
jgi:predicted dehydrogenase